jgi:hypothetical protein
MIYGMSEITDPSAASEHDFSELIESIKTPAVKAKAVRQGLPSQYRMRHDAHYVEELATRNGGIIEFESETGRTVFTLLLPLGEDP